LRVVGQVIGSISGSGRITLEDKQAPPGTPTPVDLDLEKVNHHLLWSNEPHSGHNPQAAHIV
jgi:hypothetical protein